MVRVAPRIEIVTTSPRLGMTLRNIVESVVAEKLQAPWRPWGSAEVFTSGLKGRINSEAHWFLGGDFTGLPQGYLGAFVILTASRFTNGEGVGLGSPGLTRNSCTSLSTE